VLASGGKRTSGRSRSSGFFQFFFSRRETGLKNYDIIEWRKKNHANHADRASAGPVRRCILFFFYYVTHVRLCSDAPRPVRTMTRPMHHVVCRRRVDAAAAAVLRKTMVLLLLSLVFSLSSFPSAAAECPAKCMCFKTTVRCMFLHLDRIPDRISPATTVL